MSQNINYSLQILHFTADQFPKKTLSVRFIFSCTGFHLFHYSVKVI